MRERNGDCREGPIHQTGRIMSFLSIPSFLTYFRFDAEMPLEGGFVHLSASTCELFNEMELLSKNSFAPNIYD